MLSDPHGKEAADQTAEMDAASGLKHRTEDAPKGEPRFSMPPRETGDPAIIEEGEKSAARSEASREAAIAAFKAQSEQRKTDRKLRSKGIPFEIRQMMKGDLENGMTPKQVAERYGVDAKTLAKAYRSGKLDTPPAPKKFNPEPRALTSEEQKTIAEFKAASPAEKRQAGVPFEIRRMMSADLDHGMSPMAVAERYGVHDTWVRKADRMGWLDQSPVSSHDGKVASRLRGEIAAWLDDHEQEDPQEIAKRFGVPERRVHRVIEELAQNEGRMVDPEAQAAFKLHRKSAFSLPSAKVLTERAADAWPQMREDLQKLVERYTRGKVKAVIADDLRAGDLPEETQRSFGLHPAERIWGHFDDAELAMYLSLAADDPYAVAYEEVGHMIEETGRLAARDRKLGLPEGRSRELLLEYAEKHGVREKLNIDQRYDDIYKQRYGKDAAAIKRAKDSETIWQMVAARMRGESFGDANGILDHVVRFLKKVRDYLAGKGFRDVHDVFADYERGAYFDDAKAKARASRGSISEGATPRPPISARSLLQRKERTKVKICAKSTAKRAGFPAQTANGGSSSMCRASITNGHAPRVARSPVKRRSARRCTAPRRCSTPIPISAT